MKNKVRTYYILSMNCDCGYHKEARTNLPKGAWNSAKCEFCGTMLGIGDWKILGRIKAHYGLEAMRIYGKKKVEKLDTSL